MVLGVDIKRFIKLDSFCVTYRTWKIDVITPLYLTVFSFLLHHSRHLFKLICTIPYTCLNLNTVHCILPNVNISNRR